MCSPIDQRRAVAACRSPTSRPAHRRRRCRVPPRRRHRCTRAGQSGSRPRSVGASGCRTGSGSAGPGTCQRRGRRLLGQSGRRPAHDCDTPSSMVTDTVFRLAHPECRRPGCRGLSWRRWPQLDSATAASRPEPRHATENGLLIFIRRGGPFVATCLQRDGTVSERMLQLDSGRDKISRWTPVIGLRDRKGRDSAGVIDGARGAATRRGGPAFGSGPCDRPAIGSHRAFGLRRHPRRRRSRAAR